MGRRIDKESMERVSAFRSDSCLQANAVGDLWPRGVDVDDDPEAAMVAFKAARTIGLDLVFAAVAICHPEELAEFRDFCLAQLRPYIDGPPAKALVRHPPNTWAHKAALWYLAAQAAPVNAEMAYKVAMGARKVARALGNKAREQAVRDAQLDHFERKLARIVAGEKPPILGGR